MSVQLVIEEVLVFWQKARIPTSKPWYCAQKFTILYEKWLSLFKSRLRRTTTQMDNEAEFCSELDDLFDIAAADALAQMKSEEEKAFLIAQHEKGRVGCLIDVDVKGQEKEQKRQERIEAEERRRKKAEAESATHIQSVQFDFDDDVEGCKMMKMKMKTMSLVNLERSESKKRIFTLPD